MIKTFFFSLTWVSVAVFVGPPLWDACAQEPETQTHDLEKGFYYTIKKGDTLWDLSERFFDSPWIWPDLWKKNDDVPNPHWIYPGNTIRIVTKRGEEDFLDRQGDVDPDILKEIETTATRTFFYPAMDSVGFVKKEPVEPSGAIFKVQVYKEMISEGDVVYIRPKPGMTFEPGERYTIYRILRTIKDDQNNRDIGAHHYIVGIVDIQDVTRGVALGTVHESFRNIEIDDLVMPYQERSPHIAITPSTEGIFGRVVSPEERLLTFGDNAIVFIDKGQRHGIEVGQYYTMFYQKDHAFEKGQEKEYIRLAAVDTGQLLILHTEQSTSTAIITSISDIIKKGMRLRTP